MDPSLLSSPWAYIRIMRRLVTRTRIQLILLAALSALTIPAGMAGCLESSCEGNCLDEYDDCLARSPPGASSADCGAAYDSCLKYCSAVSDAPEEGPPR